MPNKNFIIIAVALALFYPLSIPLAADEVIDEIKRIYAIESERHGSINGNEIFYHYFPWSEYTGNGVWSRTKPDSDEYFIYEYFFLYPAQEGTGGSILIEQYTPSGDWARYAEYYYYDSGYLSFAFFKIRTFHGNTIVERRYYVNRDGVIVQSNLLTKDLSTGELKDYKPGSFFPDTRFPLYMEIAQACERLPEDT